MKYSKCLILFISIVLYFCNITLAQQKVEQWGRFEIVLENAFSGNAFKEVNLTAKFSTRDTTINVSGFYDGNKNFKIRFMPPKTGTWTYITKSNIGALSNKKGSFECVSPSASNLGMVKVDGKYNFKYASGKQYYPFGTTAYAWTHMGNQLQELTLKSLKNSGFNKVRMCIFPKNYDLVKEEPEIFPYPVKSTIKDSTGKERRIWDFDHFNPAFFQHLEKRIDDLAKLGIEADLILFHPYDKGRWGFDEMPMEANIRYLKYVIARLSSFHNVWWSMANEYDYVKSKTDADWDLLSKTVYESDPYRHLCSIHGSTAKYYEYWKPWFTHVSIQDEAPVMHWGSASILRNVYNKPIIYDEVGYEGNLKQRWGRFSGEEMAYAAWMGVICGTYVTHGDAFMFKNSSDTIFWAKGGEFKGSSWKRIAFLRSILETMPGPIELADISRDYQTSTNGKGTYLIYFGKEMRNTWHFNLPVKVSDFGKLKEGIKFKLEIIDTWEMTITPCPLVFETSAANDYRVFDKEFKKIRLPEKPYLAMRITQVK